MSLRAWWNLPRGDRLRLLAMLLALPLVTVSLWALGFGRTRRAIEGCSRVRALSAPGEGELAAAERLATLAAVAGRRGVVTATCLRQALLVYGWLRLRGLHPSLQLGVRKEDGRLDAHAWVELAGIALGQGELRHAPLRDRASVAC